MRREPGLTLQGALAILGHHEPRLIGKLDDLLGGVILAAGAGAGIAALSSPAFAPLASLAAVWGWMEQKNEAVKLLSQAADSLAKKLTGTSAYERRQLIAAAHSAIVAAAFFESLSDHLGQNFYMKLRITESEKAMLVTEGWPRSGEALIDSLYASEIPAPSAVRGYLDNIEAVKSWVRRTGEGVNSFIAGLKTGENIVINWEPISNRAAERYSSHYLTLAATVPEFMVWAILTEHAATQQQLGNIRSEVAAALNTNTRALARVESILNLQSPLAGLPHDVRINVDRANKAVLHQPIVPANAERYGVPVKFPTISHSYVNPCYRIANADNARPADERWWQSTALRHDLDLMLAGYIMAPDSTRLPMLILGHPGAGKSLLTKVLAARLPQSSYTVVRVPLRQVGGNSPVIDQVQQALDLATNRRVEWWRLVDQSRDAVRVLLLDGLDELLQASSSDRSGYLQEVMEFQRVEAEQERPLVVIVTSRTVVADRVDIPSGTTVVKLDYFSPTDVVNWLQAWNESNAALITAGTVRELAASDVLQQADLARQPLLLLMLALYFADPASPELHSDLSTSSLYERLIDNFARREVAKRAEHALSLEELGSRTRSQIERLSVAALAMFNRKRLDISESELGADLDALTVGPASAMDARELGQRLIGEFFFVHASEARQFGTSQAVHGSDVWRRYEFLHATFGEYLLAYRVLNELIDVSETALGGRRGPREPDDDLLFALLSHQPLVGRRSTLTFAAEIFRHLSERDREDCLTILETLIGSHRSRHISDRYLAYRPSPMDRIRQLGTYAANLVSLRVALNGGAGVPLSELVGREGDSWEIWRSTVNLWRAGLDADGFQALMASLSHSRGSIHFGVDREAAGSSFMLDVWAAQLTDDKQLEARLRFGMGITDHAFYSDDEGSDWEEMMKSWLIPYAAGVSDASFMASPPDGTPAASVARVAALIMRVLRDLGGDLEFEARLVELLLQLPRVFEIDTRALAAAVIRHSTLVGMVPALGSADIFGASWPVICMCLPVATVWKGAGSGLERSAEDALWNWRSHYLQKEALPAAVEPAIDQLLKAYPGAGLSSIPANAHEGNAVEAPEEG